MKDVTAAETRAQKAEEARAKGQDKQDQLAKDKDLLQAPIDLVTSRVQRCQEAEDE